MKKKKMIVAGSFIAALVVIYAIICILEGHVFVKNANYDVTIEGKPPLSGKLYRIRGGELMLVVYPQNEDGIHQAYVLDLVNHIAGLLSGIRTPINFLGYGYVSNWIYDGYPGASERELRVEPDGDDLEILIGGPSEEALKGDYVGENLIRLYKRKILLTKK